VSAVLALRVGDVECVVRCAVLDGEVDELEVLLLREVVLQVAVQGAAAVGILIGLASVQDELVQYAGVVVCVVEVGVVEVLVFWYPVAVLLVPTVVLAAQAFSGYDFGVEEEGLLLVVDAVALVLLLDGAQDELQELDVLGIVAHFQSQEACCFVQAVDADGGIELADVDVSSVGCCEHAAVLHLVEHGLVGDVVLVDALQDGGQVKAQEGVEVVVAFCAGDGALGILHDAVDVQGDDVARAGHHTRQAGCRIEGVLCQLVLQSATGGQRVGAV